jgi:HD superfamily phosphodiesterase
MITIAQQLYEANKRRFEAANNPLRSHGPDHHLRVYQHALALADKLALEYDETILAGAALLHDMAAYYPEETGEQYHDFDHKIAAEVLAEINFPKDKAEAVVYAIAHHGSDAKYKRENEPVEATLLRDADKLDAFGPIGVARIVMVRALSGDTLQQIVDDFHTGGHLDRKWDSMTYEAAKAMAKDNYDYSRAFFEQLAQTLKSSGS